MAEPVWSGEIRGAVESFDDNVIRDVLFTNDLGPQPAVHSVQLFAERLENQVGELPAYWAECTMRAGLFSTTFRCDWRGQFSAVFQSLQVRAIAYAPSIMDPESYSPPSGSFRHVASVGYGGWNAARPLTYTQQQRTLIDTGGNRCTIAVPPFARRFYPRLFHYTSTNWDIGGAVSAAPLNPAMLRGIALQLDTQYWGTLTERDVLEGIDLLGAGLVTLKPHTTAGTAHLVTPVFELSL